MGFTTINAMSFSDLDQARMSGANTLFSMLQQMGNALGVAGGAIMLRAATQMHPGNAEVTTADFHIAFWAIGVVGLAGGWHFRRLAGGVGRGLRANKRGPFSRSVAWAPFALPPLPVCPCPT